MSLDLDKSAWERFAFGDVIDSITDRVDNPSEAGVDRYVGLEHLDPGVMTVQRWDSPEKVEAQKLRFQPGDVIFGRRRAYQKKVAKAEFEGICSAHALVLRARPGRIHPDFMPIFLSSEYFLERAIAISVGSLSPTVNWGDLSAEEFLLPPLGEQSRIANLLWALERHRARASVESIRNAEVERTWTSQVLDSIDGGTPLAALIDPSRPLCYGVVQPGVDTEEGVGLIRVMDLESGAPTRSALKRITGEINQQYRRSRVAEDDVLVSIVGTIGRTWIVTGEFADCNIARALARVAPNRARVSPTFLEWVLASSQVQATLDRAAFESARKTLNLSALAEVLIPEVDLTQQAEIVAQRGVFRRAAAALDAELQILVSLKSSLLADIFGGD